jgi:glyoxylase-like metal-dependent hydrolase (beta-lactamase superfamily II)
MLSLILSALISMQAVQQAAPQHRIEKVRDNIYCVFGPGGNVGVIIDNDYVVMIDGQYERSLPGLLEAVRTISDKPIKYLVNTHHHGDHVGANRMLAAQVQGIIAHTNARTRMIQEQANREPDRRGGLPDILVGEADAKKLGMVTIVVGSSDVYIAHFGPAHTDNDVAVGIPHARVIHIGDMLFLERLPFIDVESGGSFDGLAQVIGHLLSWLPEDTLVIPGHGPLCDKKELARHHSFLLAIQQHVRKNPKMSPKELADSFDKKPWEDKEPSPQFVTWETLFQAASGKGSGRVQSINL